MTLFLFVAGAQAFSTAVLNATAAPDAQCKKASHLFCCDVGTPCDCTKPRSAPGQCSGDIKGVTSYAFCCDVGTPCDCSKSGLLDVSAHTWSWQVTVDVFEGALQGFFSSDEFPHLKACASETADTYEGIKSAIEEIEKLTPSDIKAGLADLGTAMTNLKKALTDCKASEKDVTDFAKALEQGFEHPLSFAFHLGKELLVNGKDIYTEIKTAISDWKAQSYRAAGVQIGAALGKLLLVNATEVSAPDAQCKKASYLFCCKIGTPCDCTKPRSAPGQCSGDIKGVTSYAYCCDVGTPCDCSKSSLFGD